MKNIIVLWLFFQSSIGLFSQESSNYQTNLSNAGLSGKVPTLPGGVYDVTLNLDRRYNIPNIPEVPSLATNIEKRMDDLATSIEKTSELKTTLDIDVNADSYKEIPQKEFTESNELTTVFVSQQEQSTEIPRATSIFDDLPNDDLNKARLVIPSKKSRESSNKDVIGFYLVAGIVLLVLIVLFLDKKENRSPEKELANKISLDIEKVYENVNKEYKTEHERKITLFTELNALKRQYKVDSIFIAQKTGMSVSRINQVINQLFLNQF